MDKIKETYETASWIFRESITLDDFRKVIKNLKPSDNNDFKKVLVRPDCSRVFEFECQICKERLGKWEMKEHICQKPISKS